MASLRKKGARPMVDSRITDTVLGKDSVAIALCELRAVSTVWDSELVELWTE